MPIYNASFHTGLLPEEKVEALRTAQSNILGPRIPQRSERIAYEDHRHADSVKVGRHCYGLSLTVEAPRVAGAPAASAKMSVGLTPNYEEGACNGTYLNTQHDGISSISQAVTDYAMASFTAELPEDMQEILKNYASMVNVPPVGVAYNDTFPAIQLNVAAAQRGDSGTLQPKQV